MELFSKKTNHDLLKEIDKLTKEHDEIKKMMLDKVNELSVLEDKLEEVEKKYLNAVEILKERS